jgi:hypothetical protein
MKRQKPQTFLNYLASHWLLLEELFEYKPLNMGTIKRIVEKHINNKQNLETEVNNLIDKKYLIKIPESSYYEFDNFLEDLIRHLQREYSLGIAEVVEVYVGELDRLVKEVFVAVEKSNKDDLNNNLKKLESLIRKISKHVENNNQAINAIVVKAKLKDKSVSLKKRYVEVIDAWKRYVTPIGQMLEAGGKFDIILDRLEKDLNQANSMLNSRGAVISEREFVNRISVRIINIRSILKSHYKYAQDQLKPLYKAFIRNSALTRGAAVILDAINKNKTDGYDIQFFVNILRKNDDYPLPAKSALDSYFYKLKNYKPQKVVIKKRTTSLPKRVVIEFEDIIKRIKPSMPVNDIMNWLIKNVPELDTDEYIDYYFQLSHQKDFEPSYSPKAAYETKTHYIYTRKLGLSRAIKKEEN